MIKKILKMGMDTWQKISFVKNARAHISRWDFLFKKNPHYFVYSDAGWNVSNKKFIASGKRDVINLILEDDLLKNLMHGRLLEIGVGVGRMTVPLADNCKHIYGVDISKNMLKEAQERLAQNKKLNVTLSLTDGVSYPYNDNFFDYIFSYTVFQHMPNRDIVVLNIKEIARVLRNGGIAKVQFRALPAKKNTWFYGVDFSIDDIEKMVINLPLRIVKTEVGTKKKYLWVWFEKTMV